jgi:uncharacterized protein
MMKITSAPNKAATALAVRGLNFANAGRVFEGPTATATDDRKDYGETRYITGGWLDGRFVVVVWTPRDGGRRIISMRHGHDDEEQRFRKLLG